MLIVIVYTVTIVLTYVEVTILLDHQINANSLLFTWFYVNRCAHKVFRIFSHQI